MEVVGAEETFNVELLRKIVELVVSKAQMEEHFCFMYADLCRKLTDLWANVAMPAVEPVKTTSEVEAAGVTAGEESPIDTTKTASTVTAGATAEVEEVDVTGTDAAAAAPQVGQPPLQPQQL